MRARPIPRDGDRAIISAFDPPAVHRKLSSCRPDAPRDKLPKGTTYEAVLLRDERGSGGRLDEIACDPPLAVRLMHGRHSNGSAVPAWLQDSTPAPA